MNKTNNKSLLFLTFASFMLTGVSCFNSTSDKEKIEEIKDSAIKTKDNVEGLAKNKAAKTKKNVDTNVKKVKNEVKKTLDNAEKTVNKNVKEMKHQVKETADKVSKKN